MDTAVLESWQVTLVKSPRVYRGFSGATVWRLQTADGAFALRCWGAPSPPVPRLNGLHRLLRFVFERGVEYTPVPVATASGETVVERDGRLWQLEPWMPGAADFRTDPRPERLRNAMRALAAWHNAAGDFPANERERAWFHSEPAGTSPAVIERLQKIYRWQRGRLARLRRAIDESNAGERWRTLTGRVLDGFERFAPRIAADLQGALELRVPLQPCLRDVWHDHLLFTGDAVTGLIDPGACRTENVASDLARLLGSLAGDETAVWRTAVEEYGRFRPLQPAELQLLPILDRSGVLLSGMTWLDRYYLQRRAFHDEDLVLERLERIVGRFAFPG